MAAPLPKQVAAGPEEEERWGGDDGDWSWTTADGIGLGSQGGGSWQGGLVGGGRTVAEQTGDQGSEKTEKAVKLDHADSGKAIYTKNYRPLARHVLPAWLLSCGSLLLAQHSGAALDITGEQLCGTRPPLFFLSFPPKTPESQLKFVTKLQFKLPDIL